MLELGLCDLSLGLCELRLGLCELNLGNWKSDTLRNLQPFRQLLAKLKVVNYCLPSFTSGMCRIDSFLLPRKGR